MRTNESLITILPIFTDHTNMEPNPVNDLKIYVDKALHEGLITTEEKQSIQNQIAK